jgi:hypothetical protein
MTFICRTVAPLESPWVEIEDVDHGSAINEVHLQFVLRRSPYGGLCCPIEEHGTIWLAHFASFETEGNAFVRLSRCFSYKMHKSVRVRPVMGAVTLEQIALAFGWPVSAEKLVSHEKEDWDEGEMKWRVGPLLPSA